MMVKNLPDPYSVVPLHQPPVCVAPVPGSKSITNRALILAALAQPCGHLHHSVLEQVLRSEDTEIMVDCLNRLGIAVEADWERHRITVPCTPLSSWKQKADFYCGNSGTTIRFLTALLALGQGNYRLDGIERMRLRPIGDLLRALEQQGASAVSEMNNDCPPVQLWARGITGGTVQVRGDISSQYLSALLMIAGYARQPLAIEVAGELVSQPYISMTLQLMSQWGISVTGEVKAASPLRFQVNRGHYQARTYAIEPDASSASYFWAAAAITGGKVSVPGLANSMQGDVAFRDALVQMGCSLVDAETIQGGPLHGITLDMNAISDTVMTLAVVALFAQGSTTITNIGHIRHKETDRIAALAHELRKVGVSVDEHADGLTIHPGPLHGATLATYHDHRMAMSLALIGLVVPGIRIENPGCVAKTFPSYWHSLENLRQ